MAPKTRFDPKTWDPTCGRSGYYSKEASPMNSCRVLASPDSRLKSQPAYGFSHEKRPRPGAKQAQRLEMPPQPVQNASPGPIYLPDIEKDGQKPTAPRYSLSNGRHKDLRSSMNNPAPDAYQVRVGLGIKHRQRVPRSDP